MDYSNIPTGLKITTQIPLNVKEFCKDEDTLAYLGVDDNLAFTYHDQLEVLCLAEKSIYIWREVQVGEENTGLVALDFTYPNNHIVYGIDYSNRVFNFFQIEYVSVGDIITYTGTNIGNGSEILKNITGTSTKTFNFKKINSDNLTIIDNGDDLTINTPMTASIPALYVNNLYEPSYPEWLAENKVQNGGTAVNGFVFRGKGTLAQPFTDSIVYPLANGSANITPDTAIQNALDGDSFYNIPYSYMGNGTRLSPQKAGQKITVQNNIIGYNFLGNLGYSRLDIEFLISSNITSTGMLFDLDNVAHFNTLSDRITIRTVEGVDLICTNSDGFNNSGTNIATNNFSQSRTVSLLGRGSIVFTNNNITKYIINSDVLSTGNNNDGNLTFNIECKLRADYQGLVKIGGVSRVYSYGELQSSYNTITINPALKAFLFLGGQFRSLEGSKILFSGVRDDGFVFTPTGGFTPNMVGQSVTLVSENIITNLFNKTNNNIASLTFNNSDSSVQLLVDNIFESTNLWSITFNRNIFERGVINNTKADLTMLNSVSVTNSIGGNMVENLIIKPSRTQAIADGVPLYSAYLKTGGTVYPNTATWVRDIVLPA